MADSRKLLLKESYNNVFDTAEILWLLTNPYLPLISYANTS